jgi:hypothetical protein
MIECKKEDCNFYDNKLPTKCEEHGSLYKSLLDCSDYNIHNLQLVENLTADLALYKKALELACRNQKGCNGLNIEYVDDRRYCLVEAKQCPQCWQDHFLTKAKGGE